MIDIRRNDGAAARHLVAYEFRRDLVGDRRAEGISVSQRRAPQILSRCDEFHLLGDDSCTGMVELRNIAARLRAQGLASGAIELRYRKRLTQLKTIVLRLARASLVGLDVAAGEYPVPSPKRKALLNVDTRRMVRI